MSPDPPEAYGGKAVMGKEKKQIKIKGGGEGPL